MAVGGTLVAAHRGNAAIAQTEEDPVATAETVLNLEPLLPILDPIPLGSDNYLVNGQTVFIDPDVASTLFRTPTVSITVEGETLLVDLETVVFADGTPPAAQATPEVGVLETLWCGLDNSQDVELYNGDLGVSIEFLAAHHSAVGNLRWNGATLLEQRYESPGTVASWRWCSGTLISEDLFLTAGHCFEQRPGSGHEVPKINGTQNPIPRTEIATNMNVNFGYQVSKSGQDQRGESFPVVELVEDGYLSGFDYAIVRLDGTPGLIYGVAKVAATEPAVGDLIIIFGRPLGSPKRIYVGPVSALQDHQIFYDTIAINFGSSGSGILLAPDGPIVGVHTTSGCTEAGNGQNSGVLISYLLQASPILRSLAQ
jgi:hypothetical protein